MQRVAVLLGNRSYRHSSFNKLTAPQDDIIQLAEVLRDPELCEFDEVRLKLDASLVDAKMEIGWLLRDRHPDDLVLLYFSGHGVKDVHGTFYLALTETDPEDPDPGSIDEYWLRRALENCRSERQIVILDACYSGGLIPDNFVARDALGGPILTEESLLSQGRGRYILTSTTAESHAFEKDGKSLYTHEIVECLSRGIPDTEQAYLSIDDLHGYLKTRIAETAPPAMRPQLWCGAMREPEPLIIAKNAGHKALLTREIKSGLVSGNAADIELAIFRLEDRLEGHARHSSDTVPVLKAALTDNPAMSFALGSRLTDVIQRLERATEADAGEAAPDDRPEKDAADPLGESERAPGDHLSPVPPELQNHSLSALFRARQLQFLIVACALVFGLYIFLASLMTNAGEAQRQLVAALPAGQRAEIFRTVTDNVAPLAPPVAEPVILEFEPSFEAALPDGAFEVVQIREDASLAVLTLQSGEPTLFSSGQADLSAAYQPIISAIASVIIENGEFISQVVVVGHTDNIPVQRSNPFLSNQRLSEARAQSVRDALWTSGVPVELLASEGKGASQPVADNSTAEGRATNRRIEIFLEKKL